MRVEVIVERKKINKSDTPPLILILELLFIKTLSQLEGKLMENQSDYSRGDLCKVSLVRHHPLSVLSLQLIRLASLCHYLRVPVHRLTWWNALWKLPTHGTFYHTDAHGKESGICLYLAGMPYWRYCMLTFIHANKTQCNCTASHADKR